MVGEKIKSRPGPFEDSITYYANLLQESWRIAEENFTRREDAMLRLRIHAYL
jgi:hypothetical protein